MKELIELVNFVSINKIERNVLFKTKFLNGSHTLYRKFYFGIKERKYKSDKDAALDLYNSDAVDSRYLMVKQRLKEQLNEFVPFVICKTNEETNLSDIENYCYYDILKARVLISQNCELISKKILTKILEITQNYELTEITIDALQLLLKLSIEDNKKIIKFLKLIEKYEKIRVAEIESSILFHKVNSLFSCKINHNIELVQEADYYYKIASIKLIASSSTNEALNYYKSIILIHQMNKEFDIALKFCFEAEKYFNTKQLKSYKEISDYISISKLSCYTRLKDTTNGLYLSRELINTLPEGSTNWFSMIKNYIIISIYAEDYDLSENLFFKVTEYLSSDLVEDSNSSCWIVIAIYMQFLSKIGRIKSKRLHVKEFKKKYNLKILLSENSIITSDRIFFISLNLILCILNGFIENDREGITQMKCNIELNLKRYIKKKFSLRCYCLLKSICKLIDTGFNINRTKMITQKYINILSSVHGKSLVMDPMEIIPYDKLWEMILDLI